MGDKLGQIKVTVVKGRHLVIRDFKTSDPYVILKLANQEVFDKDHFKADDKMGNAHLSLQPLVAAARLRKILGVASEGTTLRKVIPDKDNFLAASISWVNGEVVQDVWSRLCDVESGDRVEDQIDRSSLRCSLQVESLSMPSMHGSFEPYTSSCRQKKTSSDQRLAQCVMSSRKMPTFGIFLLELKQMMLVYFDQVCV